MMFECEPLVAVEEPAQTSPFVLEFFLVEGHGFRCMAYCGADAKWHHAFNDEELRGDIRIVQ
jgi:hypothetical protein